MKNEVTSCLPSVSDVKGLLQKVEVEVELQTSEKSERVLVYATQRVVILGFPLK